MILNCTNLILFLLEALITLSRTIDSCVSDVKEVWVVQNKLHLKDNKAEILLIGSAPEIDLPSSFNHFRCEGLGSSE